MEVINWERSWIRKAHSHCSHLGRKPGPSSVCNKSFHAIEEPGYTECESVRLTDRKKKRGAEAEDFAPSLEEISSAGHSGRFSKLRQ